MAARVSWTYDRAEAVRLCHLLKKALGIEASFRHSRSGIYGSTYSITVGDPIDATEAREFWRGWKVATEQVRSNPRTFASGFTAGIHHLLADDKRKHLGPRESIRKELKGGK